MTARHISVGARPAGATASTSLPPLKPELQALRQEAFDVVETLVGKYPGDPDALYSKAAVRNRFGDSDVAVACWKQCLKLDPKFALAHYCLGWHAFERGNYVDSINSLRQAVQLAPQIDHAYLLLARALMALGRTGEAEKPLLAHVRLAPRSVEGRFRLGQIYQAAGQVDKAKQYFLAALEIDPRCLAAQDGLADVLQEPPKAELPREIEAKSENAAPPQRNDNNKRFLAGREELREGLAFAHIDVGKVYGARGDWDAALTHWQRAAELVPRDTESRELLVMVYRQAGQLEKAIPLLEQLCGIDPGNAIHRINLGVLAGEIGRFEVAEEAFVKVQELIPGRHEGYAGLAKVYLSAGRDAAHAKQLAEKAVELAPAAENYYLLGKACLECGERQAAIAALQRAAELGRSNPVYRKALDDARAKIGEKP